MKDWFESVRGGLGMQNGEAARKALSEVPEQEVPPAYMDEFRDELKMMGLEVPIS